MSFIVEWDGQYLAPESYMHTAESRTANKNMAQVFAGMGQVNARIRSIQKIYPKVIKEEFKIKRKINRRSVG